MKRLVLMAALATLCARLSAQGNLVPNGSFEDFTSCPWSAGQGNWAVGWVVPNEGSPDFYHYCSESDHLVPPAVVYGYEYPLTGLGFIGMYFFSLNQPEGREYIQVQLIEPIHAGVRYQVGFHVSLAELSLYALSSIGAHLSIDAIQGNEFDVLEVEPHIQNPAGNIIADTSGWVFITDTFTSRHGGGEQWLTIGNFLPDSLSQITFVDSGAAPNYDRSYYYIDDVSVIALDSVPSSVDEAEELSFSVWPNPAQEVLRFNVQGSKWHLSSRGVRVMDAVGREVMARSSPPGKEGLGEVAIGHLPKGIYLLELTDAEGKRAVRRFVKE